MCTESPKISIIMCTYNRKKFLEKAVKSVLNQTFKDFELILVNNGSTDGSDILCENLAKTDNRIRLFHIEENKGASKGKNLGISKASCEYITIVDDDDYCESEMINVLWDLAENYNADISMCGSWNEINGKLEPYFIYNELFVFDKFQALDELLSRKKFNVAPPTKLFKKKLFDGITFKENVLVDDIHVIYKLFAASEKIVAHGKPLYTFRKHTENMTSFIQTNMPSPVLIQEYLLAFEERTNYLSARIKEIVPRARYSEWSYRISMCEKIKGLNGTYEKIYDQMIEDIKSQYEEFYNGKYITQREKDILSNLFL